LTSSSRPASFARLSLTKVRISACGTGLAATTRGPLPSEEASTLSEPQAVRPRVRAPAARTAVVVLAVLRTKSAFAWWYDPLGRGARREAPSFWGGWGGPGQATLLMSAAAGSPAFSRRSLGPGPERAPRRCRERAA